MKGSLQAVTDPAAHTDMGLTLPHKYLFNDLSSVVDESHYAFSQQLVGKEVSTGLQWGLKHDPYCCANNIDRRGIDGVAFEINNFVSLGGKTIVDATGPEFVGQDVSSLREVIIKAGPNIATSSGPYLEKFGNTGIHRPVDSLAVLIGKGLNQGIDETNIRAGVIGEIGMSPVFTQAERSNLQAASLAQRNSPHMAIGVHMLGQLRLGDGVLDIVLKETNVSPAKVSLAHSDSLGRDVAYQRKMLDRNMWPEFDMTGLDITLPKEGVTLGVQETTNAVAHLTELGYADQIVLDHGVFLKQMWAENGGNGQGFVPNIFLTYLAACGVGNGTLRKPYIDNPVRLLAA